MAKNYTFSEAVRIINAGTDMESITDIGRRYPILLNKVTKVAALAGDAFVDLMNFMPDYLTANKVNSALKAISEEATETEDDSDATTETTETETETNEVDYESMSGKQLWDILGKAGLRKTAKSTKKADLVAACKAMDAAKAGAKEEDEAETDEAETESNPYEGKSAMELFKECKKRGIKAAPKKNAKFYADLLIKADAEAETENESDDWDDEEEETKSKPAKKTETEKKAKATKAAKKDETDEDDDWDI